MASRSLSENTLKRNMNAWGLSIRPRIKVTSETRQRIYDLYYQERYYTDQQMAKFLRRDGFVISFRKLAKLRKEMGLSKRKDTIIPANPVVPSEVRTEDESDSSNNDDEDEDADDEDVQDDENDMEVDAVMALEDATRPQQPARRPPQPAAQIREPAWRKKRPSNAAQPVHQAPRITTTFTDSRHSPIPPSRHVVRSPKPPLTMDDSIARIDTEVYSQPPAGGQGLARRVTTLVTRIEAVEAENTSLKQQADQQRSEVQELRQLVQQQNNEMDVMRASLNELIDRFNAAHYAI
ncbi:hypothetical protein QM012_006752 [Aureobasidium pullulans]|uniref:Clr5 domain-containing protein n=1 Tax=Aureobasidium pullulans TaxID=5580 RepID=A0ABR0TPS3_AURPU